MTKQEKPVLTRNYEIAENSLPRQCPTRFFKQIPGVQNSATGKIEPFPVVHHPFDIAVAISRKPDTSCGSEK